MKIKEIHSYFRKFELREPYSIAYDTVDSSESVFLHLLTDEGLQGWGCAAPDPLVTGESAREVLADSNKILEPYLKGMDILNYGRILADLKPLIPGKPASLAMVDMAIYDILAQRAGMPLFQFLGGYRDAMPTSVTIGIMPLKQTLSYAKFYLRQGFRILKVKGGDDVQLDIERMVRIREIVGKDIKLRFDANQGYTLQDAIAFIKGVKSANVQLLEQPTAKSDFNALKQLTQHSALPVMADESLITLRDAFLLSRDKCIDLINIKLMKTGGIHEAMHVNSVARAGGIQAMVGCMDESALGISAALHFALSRQNIVHADLDGHLDLINDPFEGLVKIKEGKLYPSNAPGLGISSLRKFTL